MNFKGIFLAPFYILSFVIIAQNNKVENTPSDLTEPDIVNIVDSIEILIERNYYNPSRSKFILTELEKRRSEYLICSNKDSLAKILSRDLKTFSQDSHMYVQVLQDEKDRGRDWAAYETEQEIINNYGFIEMQILPDNIGYLKIIEFMHPKRSMATAVAAMKMVENTKALIIDLRDNGGGYPGIMEYLIGHYFEGEPELLSRTELSDGRYTTTHTTDLLMGKLRVNTPLYILINEHTASAAEYMAYILQAYNKATIVGEPSAGGANRNEFYSLPNNFRISISVASPIVIKTNTNWEGVGVIPDIKTATAKEEALMQIRENHKSE